MTTPATKLGSTIMKTAIIHITIQLDKLTKPPDEDELPKHTHSDGLLISRIFANQYFQN